MTADDISSRFGAASSPEAFGSIYSKAFASFLGGPDVNGTARLVSCHVSNAMDTVVFEIETVLPQYPLADIRAWEPIACIFAQQGDYRPDVLALRSNFPRLPHQNLCGSGSPRSLCLDASSWSESKYRWSPSLFLESIRNWLSRATTGTLHSSGQPREPLLVNPCGYLILPSNVELDHLEKLEIRGEREVTPMMLWAERINDAAQPGKGKFRIICFQMPSREHGIIESQPANLAELEALCSKSGFDLRSALTGKLKSESEVYAGKLAGSEFAFNLLLILHQEVTGSENTEVVNHEEWAFIIGEVASIGEALGILTTTHGMVAPPVVPQPVSEEKLLEIKVLPIAMFRRLNEKRALATSGIGRSYPTVAVLGLGSLGSKIIEILARQGLSKGVLIDKDRLFPHNTGRHVLLGCSVGLLKVTQMAAFLNSLHDSEATECESGFTSIDENFVHPLSDQVGKALRQVSFVMDFSASVSVSRGLAVQEGIQRCITAFITPGADTLFIHVEDSERQIRLDWLEAVTLRAIVEEPLLGTSYLTGSSEIWHGGPCREVSTVLPNENMSLFAAACAGFFSRHYMSSSARCVGYKLNCETLELEAVQILASKPSVIVSNGWTIKYDAILVNHLKALREERLPNETGGVLLGIVDRESMTCSIVLGSGSPADSQEWPNSYIRGVAGLKSFVDEHVERTAGQLQYVGEWHSHPSGASNAPSRTDLDALEILMETMGREGLPAIALIVAEESEPFVLVGWNC